MTPRASRQPDRIPHWGEPGYVPHDNGDDMLTSWRPTATSGLRRNRFGLGATAVYVAAVVGVVAWLNWTDVTAAARWLATFTSP